jgi:sensor histidine kinase YesM
MYPIHKKNLALLHDLSEEMQTFSIGDPPPVIIKSNDEVEVLGRILNNLVTNVNIQAKDIAIKEKENAQALYKLMITQLDPHFVRNTMNIINIMARHNRNEDIIVVNNALLRILRDRLNTTNAIFATVADEIKMLQQYMLIISYRYASSVNISYDVNEDAEDKFILKNILQLLVENSLFHGLLEEDDTISGNISVMIYPMEDSIVIEVNDDGKGIEEDRLKLLQESNYDINRENNDAHIGLKNIYDRLSYIYDEFHMEIFSEPGNGTTVIISTSVATTPGMK